MMEMEKPPPELASQQVSSSCYLHPTYTPPAPHLHPTCSPPARSSGLSCCACQVQGCKKASMRYIGMHITSVSSRGVSWTGCSYSEEELWGRVSQATGHLMGGPLLQRLHAAMQQKEDRLHAVHRAELEACREANRAAGEKVLELLVGLRDEQGWVGQMTGDMGRVADAVYRALCEGELPGMEVLVEFQELFRANSWKVALPRDPTIVQTAAALLVGAAVDDCFAKQAAEQQVWQRQVQESCQERRGWDAALGEFQALDRRRKSQARRAGGARIGGQRGRRGRGQQRRSWRVALLAGVTSLGKVGGW
jgi:hypothetical protein